VEAELERLGLGVGAHAGMMLQSTGYDAEAEAELRGSEYQDPATDAAVVAEIDTYFESLTSRGVRFQIRGSDHSHMSDGGEVSILPVDDPSVPLPDPDAHIFARCLRVQRQQLLWTFFLQDIYMRIQGKDAVMKEGKLYVDPTTVIAPEQYRPSSGYSVGAANARTRKPASRKRIRLDSSVVCNQSSKL